MFHKVPLLKSYLKANRSMRKKTTFYIKLEVKNLERNIFAGRHLMQ